MRGSSYPARNDETISTPPNKFLGSGLQLHAGPAGGTRRCDTDPSDAASLQPRNFRVESSHEKTNHAPNWLFARISRRPLASGQRCSVRSMRLLGCLKVSASVAGEGTGFSRADSLPRFVCRRSRVKLGEYDG